MSVFLNCDAKVRLIFDFTKFFENIFIKILQKVSKKVSNCVTCVVMTIA